MSAVNIVVMKKEGQDRKSYSDALAAQGFNVSFFGAIESTFELLAELKPPVFLMFSDTLEETQLAVFLQSLEKKNQDYLHFKVMITKELTAPMYALASDVSICKLLKSDLSPEQIAAEIKNLYANVDVQSQISQALTEISESSDELTTDQKIRILHKEHPENIDAKIEYGHLLIREELYNDAELLAAGMLNKLPQNVRAMGLLSRVALKKGNLQGAIDLLNEANALSSESSTRLCELGELYFEKGNYEKSKEHFEKASKLDPENKDAIKGTGRCMIEIGPASEAISFFQKSMTEDELASFFNNTGVLLIKGDKFEEGIRLYNVGLQSLKSNKYKPHILFNTAIAYKKNGDLEKALEKLQAVLKVDPKFEKAKLHIAGIKKAMSKA